jgi:hypothetical protein
MAERGSRVKNVPVIDVGGTSVKILATGQTESRSFRSDSAAYGLGRASFTRSIARCFDKSFDRPPR